MSCPGYFAPLVPLPDIVIEPGQYRTRNGQTVAISLASRSHDFGCYGRYSNGVVDHWHKSGRLFATRETVNDIVARIGA